jgi:hypothetical protein
MVYLLRKYAVSKHGMQRTKFSYEFFTYWKFFQLGTRVRYIINADAAAPTKVIGVLWLTKTFTELAGNWCGNIDVVCNAEMGFHIRAIHSRCVHKQSNINVSLGIQSNTTCYSFCSGVYYTSSDMFPHRHARHPETSQTARTKAAEIGLKLPSTNKA